MLSLLLAPLYYKEEEEEKRIDFESIYLSRKEDFGTVFLCGLDVSG